MVVIHAHQNIVVNEIVDFLAVDVVDGVYHIALDRLPPIADDFFSQDWTELFNVLQRRWKRVCRVNRKRGWG